MCHCQQTQQHQQLDVHGGAALLFLFLLLSATILTARLSCSSGCRPVMAPAQGGESGWRGEGHFLGREGDEREGQPVSRDFLHCEECWLGIKEEKVCRKFFSILSFSPTSLMFLENAPNLLLVCWGFECITTIAAQENIQYIPCRDVRGQTG